MKCHGNVGGSARVTATAYALKRRVQGCFEISKFTNAQEIHYLMLSRNRCVMRQSQYLKTTCGPRGSAGKAAPRAAGRPARSRSSSGRARAGRRCTAPGAHLRRSEIRGPRNLPDANLFSKPFTVRDVVYGSVRTTGVDGACRVVGATSQGVIIMIRPQTPYPHQ